MEYRKLGRSDCEVSAVSLGTWVTGGWWWGGSDEKESLAAIRRAVAAGINLIDTAPAYGFGRSERIVGEAIKDVRDSVVIATKCGLVWSGTAGEHFFTSVDQDGRERVVYRNLRPDSIRNECEQSLKRLGVEVIDLYQCHWPDPTTPIADTMEALSRLKEEGKIRAIGVSNFTAAQLAECEQYVELASDQPKYSMLSREIEASVLPYTRKHRIGILCYSPLEQGILTGAVTMDREFPEGDYRSTVPWFQEANRRRVLAFLDRIRPIADRHGVTLGQLAINWAISQEGVTSAIVGARRPEQIDENVKGQGWSLTVEEMAEIRRLLEELGKPGDTASQ